jgi:hypothetical protein
MDTIDKTEQVNQQSKGHIVEEHRHDANVDSNKDIGTMHLEDSDLPTAENSDEILERRVVRKTDRHLVPIVVVLCGQILLQFDMKDADHDRFACFP